MGPRRRLQDNVNVIDDAITDKGTVNISMKAFKWIIGSIIGVAIFILGIAWGFKMNLENKFTNSLNSTKTEIFQRLDNIENKINDLEKDDVKPNIQMDYRQDGDIKVLYDRTNNNRQPENVDRPDELNVNKPRFNPNGN